MRPASIGFPGDIGEGAGDSFLVGGGGVLYERGGGIGRLTGLNKAVSNRLKIAEAHEDDEGVGAVGEGGPVNGDSGLFGVLVAGYHGYGGGEVSVGDRDAGVSGSSDCGGDAGDDLKRQAFGGEDLGLLPAPAE